jgi:hypothetical protein
MQHSTFALKIRSPHRVIGLGFEAQNEFLSTPLQYCRGQSARAGPIGAGKLVRIHSRRFHARREFTPVRHRRFSWHAPGNRSRRVGWKDAAARCTKFQASLASGTDPFVTDDAMKLDQQPRSKSSSRHRQPGCGDCTCRRCDHKKHIRW